MSDVRGDTLGGLRTGSTKSIGRLLQVGTDGQDSSEVAADAEVKGGVVTFYEGMSQISRNGRSVFRVKMNQYTCEPIAQ